MNLELTYIKLLQKQLLPEHFPPEILALLTGQGAETSRTKNVIFHVVGQIKYFSCFIRLDLWDLNTCVVLSILHLLVLVTQMP